MSGPTGVDWSWWYTEILLYREQLGQTSLSVKKSMRGE